MRQAQTTAVRLADQLATLLRRVTSSGQYIDEIDGLRFVAIALVILTHIADHHDRHRPPALSPSLFDGLIHGIFTAGNVGVPLFFAISGFVLALPFAAHALAGAPHVQLGRYYTRRLTRIEPPYLINLTFLFIAILLSRDAVQRALLPHYLVSMVYLHNLVYSAMSPINFVAWSLEVEVQFYILAPLLARVYGIDSKRWRRAILGAAMIVLGLAGVWSKTRSFRVETLVVFQLPYFLAGFLLADLYLADWQEQPRSRRVWSVVVPVTFGLILLAARRPVCPLVVPPLILATYVGVFRSDFWGRILRARWVTLAGGMCYTAYLYHDWIYLPISHALGRFVPLEPYGLSHLVHVVVAFPIIFAASAVLFVFFEKPFMEKNWPSRIAASLRADLAKLSPRVRGAVVAEVD